MYLPLYLVQSWANIPIPSVGGTNSTEAKPSGKTVQLGLRRSLRWDMTAVQNSMSTQQRSRWYDGTRSSLT